MKTEIKRKQVSEVAMSRNSLVTKWLWEPGNGTRYTVYVSHLDGGKMLVALEYWQTWMFAREGEVPHYTYIQEKLQLSKTDAQAMEEFFRSTLQFCVG